MNLVKVDSIPNGCEMSQRVFHYVNADGTEYVVSIPSPGGQDAQPVCYRVEGQCRIAVLGADGGFITV